MEINMSFTKTLKTLEKFIIGEKKTKNPRKKSLGKKSD